MDYKQFIDDNGVVTIPSSITKIAAFAFDYNRTVKEVIISEGVIEIGAQAFCHCTNLAKVTLPNSLKKIGDLAFGFTGLTSLEIPSGLKKVSEDAFMMCSSLHSITVSEDNEYYISIDNCCLSKDGRNLVIGCETSHIPDSVICIKESAFHGRKGMKSITLPDKLRTIKDCAFAWCTSLEKVLLPNSLKEIGNFSFTGCKSLREIFIPANVRQMNRTPCTLCDSLCKVEVSPENKHYVSRNNICLTKDMTTVVFGCCINEDNPVVIVPKGVKKISEEAFSGVSCKKILLPESLSEIESGCFSRCMDLETISIPERVKTIAPYMCEGCTNLTEVNLPETTEVIEYCAFQRCSKLNNFTIPTNLRKINFWAFGECTGLSEITFNDQIETIGYLAFDGCYNLRNVIIPTKEVEIEKEAFKNCDVSIHMPDPACKKWASE